jgi:aminopeptidase N
MSVIEADFLDGMEYDGAYFLSKGFYNLYGGNPQGYLAAIAAHETAHQWWYAGVANNQALEPWLDEAMCTYTEYIFYKNIYPDYLKWWWQYRVDYYEPAGFVNLQLYDYTSYRAYRDAVYLNGAHFLDDLRALTGDEAFYAFLKDYFTTYKDQIVTADNYFALLKKHTSADLSPLLMKYFK